MHKNASVTIHYLKDVPEHITTCAQWSFDTWGHLTPHKTLDDYIESRKKYLNDELRPLTLVAFLGNTPVGMCSLAADRGLPLELTPWLAALYIVPEYRKQGIGALLESEICAKAQVMGYATIYCFTSDSTIVPWYEKLQWQRCITSVMHDHEVMVLKKTLD